MVDAVNPWLAPWESFYVIVGSSAAALTGLQFVVMALVADAPGPSSSAEIDAFGTPTVVHFCAALLISATLSAPWPALGAARAMLLVIGLGGIVYAALVARRARRQTGYRPELEDWMWYTALPALAYAGLATAAVLLGHIPAAALFVAAATALLLLFIGIHNAWDTVTYIALMQRRATGERARAGSPAPGDDAPAP